jgi:potassium channel subfamily K
MVLSFPSYTSTQLLNFLFSDILNIVTCVTFAVQHRFNDGFTKGEAFWMTICSTIVSSITNLTLIWDLVRTPNFEKAGTYSPLPYMFKAWAHPRLGSGVTRRQRSLVIITIIFLSYIALGALISSLSMSLSFVNGLYFTIVTTLTIGFGDIVPVTPAQRFIVCLYAVFGIIILGAAVRVTAEAVLEGLQVGYRRRIREFKTRRRERKNEREQVRRWRVAIEGRLIQRGLDVWTPDKPTVSSPSSTPTTYVDVMPHVRPSTLRRGSNFVPQAMYLNTEALPPDVLEEAALEAGVAPEKFIGRKFGRRARQSPPHRHHHHQQRDQQQEKQQEQQSKEGARPGRVPLDYSWTIDDGTMHVRKSGTWNRTCEWWEGTCEALRLKKTGSRTSGQTDPSDDMSYQQMIKVLEKEERRSLYTKVRHLLPESAVTGADNPLMLAWSCVGLVLYILDCEWLA